MFRAVHLVQCVCVRLDLLCCIFTADFGLLMVLYFYDMLPFRGKIYVCAVLFTSEKDDYN